MQDRCCVFINYRCKYLQRYIQLNCGWIGSRELCETESIMSDTIVRITDWSHSCKYDVTSPDWDTAVDGVAVGPGGCTPRRSP